MKKLFAAFAVLVVGVLLSPIAAHGDPTSFTVNGTTIRIEMYKPVKDVLPDWATPQVANDFVYEWVQVPCDGTADLSGAVRIKTFASTTNNTVQVRHRLTYTPGERWYQYIFPKLVKNAPEIQTSDTIQDLDQLGPHTFTYQVVGASGTGAVCAFNVSTITDPDEGFVSQRLPATDLLTNLSFEVTRYGDNFPIPCGNTTISANRIKVNVFADWTVPGIYNVHVHVENQGSTGVGPDQNTDNPNRRWWELGSFGVALPNTNGAIGQQPHLVSSFTTNTSGQTSVGQTTLHFAQQTAPGQPKNEIFCTV